MFPTPTVNGNNNRAGSSPKAGNGLATAVRLWPTPQAGDYRSANRNPGAKGNSEMLPQSAHALPAIAAMYPTPRASDHKGSGPVGSVSQKHMAERDYLCAVVATEDSGQLNPDWVEWLMGLPCGWTDIDAEVEPPAPPADGEWWPEEPAGILRVASGIPNRADRLKGLGNMVVPRQFFPIFQAIAAIAGGAV